MLRIARKHSQELTRDDLQKLIGSYIEREYEDDPAKYSSQIQEFQELRVEMHSVETDLKGRDLLYRYYGQLDMFAAHFDLDETKFPLSFVWKDVFNGEKVEQMSYAYEKACVIFNMAALMSSLAAQQNRLEDSGLKTAFNYFQCAAGVFQYISDNFLHSPTMDLSKECIQFMSELMLAQAQEVFCEKALMDQKKNGMLAKLLQQCYQMYLHLVDMVIQKPLEGFLPGMFSLIVQWKTKYFISLSNYYQSLVNEADGKYGEQVGRLELADSSAKECVKIAKDIISQPAESQILLCVSYSSLTNALNLEQKVTSASLSVLSSFSSSSVGVKKPGQLLSDISKTHQAFIENTKLKAIKENDIIYHDLVPDIGALPVIDKVNMTKPVKMSDLFPNIGGIVGPDIFQALIPMAVHEKSSLYSEEKAAFLRKESAKVSEADESMAAILASYNYPQLLSKFKSILNTTSTGQVSGIEGAPKEVLEWSAHIVNEERNSPISQGFQEIEALRGKIRMGIERGKFLLQEEHREYDSMKEKYQDRWIQTSASAASLSFDGELKNFQRDLGKGAEGDSAISAKISANQANFDLLKSSDRLNQHYIQGSLCMIDQKTKSQALNLLDLPIDTKSDAEVIIKKIEDTLARLNQLKSTRKKLLEQLKEKVQRDDISQALLNKKKAPEAIFQQELEKFNAERKQIDQSLAEQNMLLKSLEKDHNAMAKTSVLADAEKIAQARTNMTQAIKESRVNYDTIKTNLRQGIGFYKDLAELVDKSIANLNQFLDSRRAERDKLQKDINLNDAKILTDKISKLSTAPNPSIQNYSAPAPQPVYQPIPSGTYQQTGPVSYSPQQISGYHQQAYNAPPFGQFSGSYNPPFVPSVERKSSFPSALPAHLQAPLSMPSAPIIPATTVQQQQYQQPAPTMQYATPNYNNPTFTQPPTSFNSSLAQPPAGYYSQPPQQQYYQGMPINYQAYPPQPGQQISAPINPNSYQQPGGPMTNHPDYSNQYPPAQHKPPNGNSLI